jgi:small-conductance mechanosensitive channel
MSSDEDFKSNNPNEEGVDSENTDSNVPVEEPTTPVVTPPEETPPTPPEETPPTPPEETPPTPPEEPPYSKVEEELKRAAESAEALRLAAEKEREERLEALKKEREVIHAEAQALTDEINVKEEKASQFSIWVERHRRTFLWKMFARMRRERDAVVAKRDSFASTMANLELPEPGELVRLRQRFHKTILSVLGISLFLWLAYFLITTFLPFAWVIQLTSLGSTIFRYVLGAALLTVFSALVLYYRDWRRFDWKVKSLIKKLENIKFARKRCGSSHFILRLLTGLRSWVIPSIDHGP